MNGRTFEIKKDSKIIVYGAAYLGHMISEVLDKYGYEIMCYIDSRSSEIDSMRGKPVYSLQQAAKLYTEVQPIVILAVKNVFEHSKIANGLIKAGFVNLIYKPREIIDGIENEELEEISNVFDMLQAGKDINGLKLSCTEYVNAPKKYENYLIEECDSEVVAMLPIQLLFQDCKGITKEDDVEINAMYLFPHIEFFQYLQGKADRKCEQYVNYCKQAADNLGTFKPTKAWEQNVIRNRAEVYEEMNKAYHLDKDFFYRSAPKVTWNKKGYFNLNSGKHRAAFFASKGLAYIPVRMSKDDLNEWLNDEETNMVFSKLVEREKFEIVAPIEHPYYYDYPCVSKSFFENLLFVLARECSTEWYQKPDVNFMYGRKIYINIQEEGYLSRYFRRMGCDVFVENINDIEKPLDAMMYINRSPKIYRGEEIDLAIVEGDTVDFADIRKKIKSKLWIFITEEEIKADKLAGGLYKGLSKYVYKLGEESV